MADSSATDPIAITHGAGIMPSDHAISLAAKGGLDKLLRNVDMLDQLALELQDIAQLNAGELDVARACAKGLGAPEIDLRSSDFIASIDNYNLKALCLAQRYFAGDRQLWI